MKNILIKAGFLAFLCALPALGFSQLVVPEEQKIEATTHLAQLKSGYLVILLPTQSKKIALLEDLVFRNPSNARHAALLAETKKEVSELQESIVKAYKAEYHFSKYLFMPDTMAKELRNGERTGLFVDENLAANKTLSIPDKEHYYIAYIGRANAATSTGKKSLLIETKEGKLLQAPFPYAVPLFSFFNLFSNKKAADTVQKAVAKQEEKLRSLN